MSVMPYVGEISLWANNRPMPDGWLPCNGALVDIASYNVLYAVIGTQFGGNGHTNFALPNLAGRVIVGAGHAPGLGNYLQGQVGGAETVSLREDQMPKHNHGVSVQVVQTGQSVATALGTLGGPPENGYAAAGNGTYGGVQHSYFQYQSTAPSNTVELESAAVTGTLNVEDAGTGEAHTNLQPYIVLQYFIAWDGEFPPRP